MSIAFSPTPLTIPRSRKLYPFPIARNRLQVVGVGGDCPLSGARIFAADEARSSRWRIQVVSPGGSTDENSQGYSFRKFNVDAVLSMMEIFLIIPPAIYSIGSAVALLAPGAVRPIQASLSSNTFVWQFLLLVGSIAVGILIRRRQWKKICRETESGLGTNLLARIEKMEEDVRSSNSIVRVLSRQLEKLGIRFRVTRKALKGPITETAALAQKNSEATRALTLQGDILEKEIGEIQKVLLAMQEQQQKQLELILAIGKASKLFENKQDASSSTDQNRLQTPNTANNSIPRAERDRHLEVQTDTLLKGNNDKP